MCRDGNFYPIRGYPVRPDPNGPDFTRSDKEQGRVWVFQKKTRTGSGSGTGFYKSPTRPDQYLILLKKKKILGINTTLSLQKIISLTLISQLSAAPPTPSLAAAGPSSISPVSSVPASLIELLTHPPRHRDRQLLPHHAAHSSISPQMPLTPPPRRRCRSFLQLT